MKNLPFTFGDFTLLFVRVQRGKVPEFMTQVQALFYLIKSYCFICDVLVAIPLVAS